MSSLKRFIQSRRLLRESLMPLVKLTRSFRHAREDRLSTIYSELFRSIEGGSLIVRPPGFAGSFEFDARSHILRRVLTEGQYEREIVRVLENLVEPDRDAIDVGANVGLYTILLSRLVSESSRVLAIEPAPQAIAYLHRNLARNDSADKVIVYEGVASNEPGTTTLKVIAGREEYSTLGDLVHPSIAGEPYSSVGVVSDTIDALVEKWSLRPGFIKIDTEGSELDVLTGGEKTLKTFRPIVLCEAWSPELALRAGATPGATAKYLQSHDYRVSRLTRDEILAVPADG